MKALLLPAGPPERQIGEQFPRVEWAEQARVLAERATEGLAGRLEGLFTTEPNSPAHMTPAEAGADDTVSLSVTGGSLYVMRGRGDPSDTADEYQRWTLRYEPDSTAGGGIRVWTFTRFMNPDSSGDSPMSTIRLATSWSPGSVRILGASPGDAHDVALQPRPWRTLAELGLSGSGIGSGPLPDGTPPVVTAVDPYNSRTWHHHPDAMSVMTHRSLPDDEAVAALASHLSQLIDSAREQQPSTGWLGRVRRVIRDIHARRAGRSTS